MLAHWAGTLGTTSNLAERNSLSSSAVLRDMPEPRAFWIGAGDDAMSRLTDWSDISPPEGLTLSAIFSGRPTAPRAAQRFAFAMPKGQFWHDLDARRVRATGRGGASAGAVLSRRRHDRGALDRVYVTGPRQRWSS